MCMGCGLGSGAAHISAPGPYAPPGCVLGRHTWDKREQKSALADEAKALCRMLSAKRDQTMVMSTAMLPRVALEMPVLAKW